MDWDKLRIFHKVAEAGSFTHAGEALGLSQSAVSRQIATLEDSVGVALFHRHARGLVLTEQGEILFKTSSDIFRRLSMIEAQLSDSKDQHQGPLLITCAGFIGSQWLAPLLPDFIARNPGIELSLLLDDRVFNLGIREADAAIRLYKPESQSLIQKQLGRIEFGLYASPAYLAACGTPHVIDDLAAHTVLTFPDAGSMPFEGTCWLLHQLHAHQFLTHPPRYLTINSLTAILESCRYGAGLAMLPRFLAETPAATLVHVMPALRAPDIDMYYVYPEERRQARRIMLFRDFLLEKIAATPFLGKDDAKTAKSA